jgi:5-methyltetrahydropteroyltriglutamate--homocysteine methyltransferase
MLEAKYNHRLHDVDAFEERLRSAVADVVRRQAEIGLDIVNDGEFSKPNWSAYLRDRLGGLTVRPQDKSIEPNRQFGPGGGARGERGRDWNRFPGYFAEGIGDLGRKRIRDDALGRMVREGPVTYTGQAEVERDLKNLRDAAATVPHEEVFVASVGPYNIDFQPGQNEYYSTAKEYMQANAEAMRVEYTAIVDAGFVLQIDTPVQKYNSLGLTLEEFRRDFEMAVEILNHALSGIPSSRVRIHVCYGGTHHPHTGDIEMRDLIDLLLKIQADGISYDGNVRHEHEWKIWRDHELPDGKVLIPGLVAHTTDVVEHPELVADRILRLANLVGRENVIAGTDCGLGGRVYHEVAWAKLESLVAGARIATKQLWPRRLGIAVR